MTKVLKNKENDNFEENDYLKVNSNTFDKITLAKVDTIFM